jgi:TonB family protein
MDYARAVSHRTAVPMCRCATRTSRESGRSNAVGRIYKRVRVFDTADFVAGLGMMTPNGVVNYCRQRARRWASRPQRSLRSAATAGVAPTARRTMRRSDFSCADWRSRPYRAPKEARATARQDPSARRLEQQAGSGLRKRATHWRHAEKGARCGSIYPEQARKSNVHGIVILQIAVGSDGRVLDAKVVRSIPLLDAAAIDAVRQWQYEPTGTGTPITLTSCGGNP